MVHQEVVFDVTGLPRPGPQALRQRERTRRFLLRQVADLDVDSLPRSLEQLVLRAAPPRSWRVRRPTGRLGALDADERQRLVNALVARSLDANGVATVLNLIGDLPLSEEGLKAMVDEAEAERERIERPGENFSVTGVQRSETRRGLRFQVRLRHDDGREFEVWLSLLELAMPGSFRRACIEQRASFVPILKATYDGKRYEYFVDELLRWCRET